MHLKNSISMLVLSIVLSTYSMEFNKDLFLRELKELINQQDAHALDKFLISHNRPSALNLQDERGYQPMYFAVKTGNDGIVSILLKHGASFDSKSMQLSNYEQLYAALYKRYTGSSLVKPQYHPQIDGRSIFDLAAEGDPRIFNFINQSNSIDMEFAGFQLIHCAASGHQQQVAQRLINQGADINVPTRDANGYTPFHLAVLKNRDNLNFLEWMASKGAKIDTPSPKGIRPLYLASCAGNLAIVQWLIENGANMQACTNDGMQAIHGALLKNQTTVAHFLISNCCFSNTSPKEYLVALIAAVKQNNEAIIEDLINYRTHTEIVPMETINCILFEQDASIPMIDFDTGKQRSIFELAALGNLRVLNSIEQGESIHAISSDDLALIHYAVHSQSKELVQKLLEYGADINMQTGGYSPLAYVIAGNDSCDCDFLDWLITQGADIDQPSLEDFYPIHLAAFQGKLAVLKLLINRGANIDKRMNGRLQVVHVAISENQTKIAKFLIKHGCFEQGKLEDFSMAVAQAAQRNNKTLLRALNDYRAKTNIVPEETMKLYMLSGAGFTSSQLEKLSNIVQVMADITETSPAPTKNTAFKPAVKPNVRRDRTSNHKKSNLGTLSAPLLPLSGKIQHDAGPQPDEDPLVAAVKAKKYDSLRELYSNLCESSDSKQYRGDKAHYLKPLHCAAIVGRLDIVKILISQGVDVNEEFRSNMSPDPEEKNTPLHFACDKGHFEVAQYLIKHGANIHAKSNTAQRPIHLAVKSGKLELVQWLVEHGADINAENNVTGHCLHVAATEGHHHIIEWLVNQKIDINRTSGSGLQAIHGAACSGHLETVKWLVDHGASINSICKESQIARDSLRNWQPIHYAAASGKTALIEYLVKNGADINAVAVMHYYNERHPKNVKPIDVAKKFHREEAISWFRKNKGCTIC